MSEIVNTQTALTLLALARFSLDLANCFTNTFTWEVAARDGLQQDARRLIEEAKRL